MSLFEAGLIVVLLGNDDECLNLSFSSSLNLLFVGRRVSVCFVSCWDHGIRPDLAVDTNTHINTVSAAGMVVSDTRRL